MTKSIKRLLTLLTAAVVLTAALPLTGAAAWKRTNTQTGFFTVIDDGADLLTNAEEKQLADVIQPILNYGSACFVTLNRNPNSTEDAAIDAYCRYIGGGNSGIIFLIDMDNRILTMQADGAIYKTVNKRYCTTITDNVYSYASDKEYYECAVEAFSQAAALLEGQRIAQPMKHISNTLLAIVLALMLNFGLVSLIAKKRKASAYGTMEGSTGGLRIHDLKLISAGTRKTYSPQSSGGGGGGFRSGGGGFSGGGGGFSGGGGGFSGGGGSHRF